MSRVSSYQPQPRASAAGRAVNREQLVVGARDFRDSFASRLRITIFQPFLSSRLSRGKEKKARLLSPECLRTADGPDPPAHAHSRPGPASGWGRSPPRAGEQEGSLAPSWREGDEREARASGGGDSLRILSLCPLAPPPPAEASPLSRVLMGAADPGRG